MPLKKRFLLDTNVLMRTPNAIYVFDDNDVLICDTTLEELDDNKTKPGDAGYNAREAIRTLNKLREDNGNLYSGVPLPGGGTLTIVRDCYPEDVKEETMPSEWERTKPDNRIIGTAIKNHAILVTSDISMLLKAEAINVSTELFRNESVSDASIQYTGRAEIYAMPEGINKLHDEGVLPLEYLCYDDSVPKVELVTNEFLTVIDATNTSHTALAYFNGKEIIKIHGDSIKPANVKPRNAGQKFAISAMMRPASEVPLVILKGSAGTAKTFLSLACGLAKTRDENEYKKILILRPNIKFDDDIGYLKGDEMDKILPLIRPCLDNLEELVSDKKDTAEKMNEKVKELFDSGVVTAEALAYLRGRSISNTYILIDEAQNTTPNQMLGIITRAGIGSKIVIVGDPDQIDNPKLDKKNNGLVYAYEKFRGNKLCMEMTFEDEECVRSPLALEASKLLSK